MGEVVLGAVGALGGGRAAALSAEQHLALLSFLCDEALDTAALRNVLQSALLGPRLTAAPVVAAFADAVWGRTPGRLDQLPMHVSGSNTPLQPKKQGCVHVLQPLDFPALLGLKKSTCI